MTNDKITDKEEALKVVKENGLNLVDVNIKLRDDDDIVLTAINENGYALVFASERHKHVRKIILTAIDHIRYIDEKLLKEMEKICKNVTKKQTDEFRLR